MNLACKWPTPLRTAWQTATVSRRFGNALWGSLILSRILRWTYGLPVHAMSSASDSEPTESLLPLGPLAENEQADRACDKGNEQAIHVYNSSSDGETCSVLTQRRSLGEKPTKLRLLEGSNTGLQHSSCLRAVMVNVHIVNDSGAKK